MANILLERNFSAPLAATQIKASMDAPDGCLQIHRVMHKASFLALDGGRMICWFNAPDAEATRVALRQMHIDISDVWAASCHEAPSKGVQGEANVVVERRFTEPVDLPSLQAKEDAFAWCFESHNVQFVRTFIANDRKRMVCMYRAPDAEAVRNTQRQAQMPMERVWAFNSIAPSVIA